MACEDPARCECGEGRRPGTKIDVAMADDLAGAAGAAPDHASREPTAELPHSTAHLDAADDEPRERETEGDGIRERGDHEAEAPERSTWGSAAARKQQPSSLLRGSRSFQNITLLLALREVVPCRRRSANFRPLWDRLWTGQRVLEAEHSPELHAARRWGLYLPSSDSLAGRPSMGSGDLAYRNGHISGDWPMRRDGSAAAHSSGGRGGFSSAAHAPMHGPGPRGGSVPTVQQGEARAVGQQICRCWSDATALAGSKAQPGPTGARRQQHGPALPECWRQLSGTCAVHGAELHLPEGDMLRHTVDIHRALGLWVERDSIKHYVAHYCPLFPPPRSTIAAAFSPDGTTLASTHGDHTVKVLNCSTGQRMKTLTGHRRTPWVVRYNPWNPDVVASGSLDHEVRLWSLATAQSFANHAFYRPIASLAFHARGTLLAVASGRHLYIWEHATSGEESQPVIVLKTRRSLRAVHFHPHGAPLLLTAEVNALDSSDSPPSEALSSGYQDYPPPSLHFADGAGGAVDAPSELESPGDGADLEAAPWQAAFNFGATGGQGEGVPETPLHQAGEQMQPTEQGARPGEDEPQLLPQNAEELSGRASEERDQRYLQTPPMEHQPQQDAPQGGGGGTSQPQLLGMAARWPQWLWPSDSGSNPGASAASRGTHPQAEPPIPATQVRSGTAAAAGGDGSVECGSGPGRSTQRGPLEGAERGNADNAMELQHDGGRGWRRETAETAKEDGGAEGEGQAPEAEGKLGSEESAVDVDMRGQVGETGAAPPVGPTDRGAVDLARLHLQDSPGVDYARTHQGAGAAQQLHADLLAGGMLRGTPVPRHAGALEGAFPDGANDVRGGVQQQQAGEQDLPMAQRSTPEAARRVPFLDASRAQGSGDRVHPQELQQPQHRAGSDGLGVGDAYDLGGMRDSLGAARPLDETPSGHRSQHRPLPNSQAQRRGRHESLHARQQPQLPQQQHQQQLQQLQQQQQQQQQQQSSQNPEVPCTVKLKLWTHIEDRPKKELDPAACRLSIPHAVLCSEMGAHFSPCGRFLAACVACVPRPNDPAWSEASPTSLGTSHWDSGEGGTAGGRLLWPLTDSRANGSTAGLQPRGEAGPGGRNPEMQGTAAQPMGRTEHAEWGSASGRERASQHQQHMLHDPGREQGSSEGSQSRLGLGWGGYAHRVGRMESGDRPAVQSSAAVPNGGASHQAAAPPSAQRRPGVAGGGVPVESRPSEAGGSRADAMGAMGKAARPIVYELRIYSIEGPLFGQVLAARGVRAAHCLTSVQFSPTSTHLLLAYGRRHSSLLRSIVVDGPLVVPVYTILEVYRISDMSLVHVLTSSEDEVNVASFHPSIGSGLVYGTKEGKVRLFQHSRVPDPVQPPYGLPQGLDLTDIADEPWYNAWTRAALAAGHEDGPDAQH